MSQPAERPAQDPLSRRQNEGFFRGNDTYTRNVTRLETYMNIRAAVSDAIAEARRLLDVGNGGVFVYDTSLAAEIVGVDLFDHAPAATPANVVLRQGGRFERVDASPIPVGRWIIQLGLRWPTLLTPARPFLFVATDG
jgi:hypothetical protein